MRHLRNGVEMPTFLADEHYDFNFQVSQRLSQETVILPGDELMVECEYNTIDRSKTTFGGIETTDEMCLVFLLVYPKPQMAVTSSRPTIRTITTALGIGMHPLY